MTKLDDKFKKSLVWNDYMAIKKFMKTFQIRITSCENNEEKEMVYHIGFTFEEICKIENFINDVKHNLQ